MPRRKTDGATRAQGFYEDALARAELDAAKKLEGLDDEIAVLRVKLAELLRDQPDSTELIVKSVNAIVRAASARYRISAASAADLADAITATLTKLGVQLLSEVDGDV